MTHLRIEQNNGVIEEVSSSIITKLYEIAHTGLDMSSNLLGRLHTPVSYRHEVQYLTANYPNLYITSDDYAIPFEDPNMLSYLNSIGVGSNGMITESLAAATTVVANSANTTVTKFNELKYFTSITGSRGGFRGNGTGNILFNNWTALEEIDISNFTSLGHSHTYGWSDTFYGCTSLKKVTASNKLTLIGHHAFRNCSNLEDITGLSGEIELACVVFEGCSKLKNSNFTNVLFLVGGHDNDGRGFKDCTTLTSLLISLNSTGIPTGLFWGCNNLTSVTGLQNITKVKGYAFRSCSKLSSIDIDWTKITRIEGESFNGCELLPITSLNCTSLLTLDAPNAFRNCKLLQSITSLGTITTISQSSFYGCIGLTSVTLPSTLTTLGPEAFYGCTSLPSITLPSTLTTIGDLAFYGCSSLPSITLPSTLTTIGDLAFYGCSSLASINLDNITKLGYNAFRDCSNLGTNLTLELNLTNLTRHFGSAFRGTKFKKIILHAPSQVLGDSNNEPFYRLEYTEYIDASDFPLPVVNGRTLTSTYRDNNLITCIYPSNTNFLESNSFKCAVGTYRYMILLSTTPPSLKTGDNNNPTSSWLPQGSTLHIYVPDSAKADYLADPDWSSITGSSGDTIADRLHGLSELPAGIWTTGLASLYLSAAQLVAS